MKVVIYVFFEIFFYLQAAEKLRITASELCKLQIADGIIPVMMLSFTYLVIARSFIVHRVLKSYSSQEPLGGAHADPSWTSQQIKIAINKTMDVCP